MTTVPYPGLRTFRTSEHALFFGQEANAEELFSILGMRHFVAVVGESGCGKSSLVRAGLVPLLLPPWSASQPSWDVIFTQPGMSPIANLARALSRSRHLSATSPELEAGMRQDEQAVVRMVEWFRDGGMDSNDDRRSQATPKHLLLVVDQFEELFRFRREGSSSEHRDDEAAVYVKLLLNAAKKESADIFVVLTMRSEYLGDSAQFYSLAEAINAGLFLLPRMNRVQCEDAIVEPARRFRSSLPAGLIQRLLNEAEERADGLPLLQHGLRYLWDTTPEEQRLRGEFSLPAKFKKEKARDLIAWSFDEHLDAVYGDLTEQQKAIAGRIFKLLGERDPRGRLIRRPTQWCEMRAIDDNEQAVLTVLNCFRDEDYGRTFLVPSHQKAPRLNDADKVDLSHEVLLRQWSRYATWLNEEEEDSANYIWLADAAYRKKRGDIEPLQGLELKALVNWRDTFHPSETWAGRYAGPIDAKLKTPRRNYAEALQFLKESEDNAARELAEERLLEQAEKRKLKKGLFFSWLSFLTIFALAAALVYLKVQARGDRVKMAYVLGQQNAFIEAKLKDEKLARAEEERDSQIRFADQQVIDEIQAMQSREVARRLSKERDRLQRENRMAIDKVNTLLQESQEKNRELIEAQGGLTEANKKLNTDKMVDDMRLNYAQLESRAEKARSAASPEVMGTLAVKDLRDLANLDRDLTPRLVEDRRRASDAVLALLSAAVKQKLLVTSATFGNLQQFSAGLDSKGRPVSFGLLRDDSLLPHVAATERGAPRGGFFIGASAPLLTMVDEFDPMEMTPVQYVMVALKRNLLRKQDIPSEWKATAAAMNADATLVVIGNDRGWVQFSKPRSAEERTSRQVVAVMKSAFRLRLDHDPVTYLQFDHSGRYVITRSDNRRVRVIDFANKQIIGTGNSPPISSADISPNGRTLVMETSSGRQIWRRAENSEWREVPGNAGLRSLHGPVQFLDDHTVLGAATAGTCLLIDVGETATGPDRLEHFRSASCALPGALRALAISHTGLAALTDGTSVEIVDPRQNKTLLWVELQRINSAPIGKLVFNADATRLLAVDEDGFIQSVDTSELLKPDGAAQLTVKIHALRLNPDAPRTPDALQALLSASQAVLRERELTERERALYLK